MSYFGNSHFFISVIYPELIQFRNNQLSMTTTDIINLNRGFDVHSFWDFNPWSAARCFGSAAAVLAKTRAEQNCLFVIRRQKRWKTLVLPQACSLRTLLT